MSKNPEYFRRKARQKWARRADNPEYWARKAARNSARQREKRLAQYGLDADTYDALLAEQDGCCAACHEPPSAHRRLGVLFNKQTQTVQGLLCGGCRLVLRACWGNTELKLKRLSGLIEFLEMTAPEDPEGGR